MPQPLRRFIVLGLIMSALASALLVANFGGAGAATVLSEPQPLPGDTAPAAAFGTQQHQRIAKGADTSLAVWTDVRTAINPSATQMNGAVGSGSLQDIYAARINASGQVIDTTPIIIDQSGFNQIYPAVGWNGSNWLVVWLAEKGGEFHTDWEIRAARVSPAGQVLDATPIVLKADADSGLFPFELTDDGAGNWVVTWSEFLPQEGTSIPRGAIVTKVANDGSIAMPSRVIYNHHSQYMSRPKLSRAGDRYLLTFIDVGFSYGLKGVTYDLNFNQLRNGPESLGSISQTYDLATDGNAWFVTWIGGASGNVQSLAGQRVSHQGDPEGAAFVINSNVGVSDAHAAVCWDGQYYFIAYESGFNHATQAYDLGNDILASRVTATGQVLDPTGIVVKANPNVTQYMPAVAPGVNGGAQIVWQELQPNDVHTARLSREGAVTPDAPLAQGAPTQTEVRMASNGNGFLAVFRRDVSNVPVIMGQRLNADGSPADQAPFLISDQPSADNPSVGWNGSTYLVVWDAFVDGARKTYGATVPAVGAFASAPTFLMNGDSPDAAGLNGEFVVVNIIQRTAQIRRTQFVRVSGAGTPVGTPTEIEGVFNFVPRVAAFGERWLAVWEYHGNHDDAPARTHGSFIAPSGSFTTPFDIGDGGVPHLAVAGTTGEALVVWSSRGNTNTSTSSDIRGRRINADGSSPDTVAGMPVTTAPNLQTRPAVTWDGNQYVVTWVDFRNETFPQQQPKGDIYAARVARTNVPVEEFPVSNSALPEETPFVIASNGLTVFAYAKFYPQAPYAALRITTRNGRLDAPPPVLLPSAPTSLIVTQNNAGLGTVTADATLTWADNSNDEAGFKVEVRGAGATAFTQVALLPANTTTYTLSAHATQVATYRVRAYNSAGDTAYTNEATPPVHSYADISPRTYNEPASVRLASTATDADGIARVEFYYATDETYPNFALLATDTTAPYEFNWTNVAGGSYYTRAKAYDGQGSSTTVLNNSFVVYRAPTANISAPVNNAAFAPGSTVTINATAQTTNNRSDEYVTGVSFYANTTLLGTVQGSLPSYTFNWANAPAGNYSLTARPSTSLGLTGSSAPVNITVGAPSASVAGRVTNGSAPMYGVTLTLTGSQSATATTDANGNFVFTNLQLGGSYTVAASANGFTFAPATQSFNNVTSTQTANFAGTPGPAVTPDPNAAPIYTQPSDGRAVEGPSSKLVGSAQSLDAEVADDFDLSAEVTRVRVRGSRGGYNLPPNPNYVGIYVRFYEGSSGAPGAVQAQYYLPKGAPGVIFDAAQPSTFDVTLPTPFNANGRHYVSVQPVYGGSWEAWHPVSGNYPLVRGSVWYKRDLLAENKQWAIPSSVYQHQDMSFDLFGTLHSGPRLDSFAPASAQRSGIVRINGEFFGTTATQGTLRIDGKPSPFISYWSDRLIVAHVPETATLGPVTVSVTGPGGTVTGTLNVTTRQSNGRIRWRMEAAGDYILGRPAVAPPGAVGAGTIYAATNAGYLYAWTPDGALKWVAAGASGDDPVSVGPDGTIYAASVERTGNGTEVGAAVNAFNPDGTRKWSFIDANSQTVRAGPSVGPDGKIYTIMRPLNAQSKNLFALNPNGTVAWSVNRNYYKYGSLGKEIVFGRSLPHLYFAFDGQTNSTDPRFTNGGFFAYTLSGQLVWEQPVCCGVPAVPPDDGVRYADARFNPLTGQLVYDFSNDTSYGTPDAGPDNVHYAKVLGTLYGINPNGSEKWRYNPGETAINSPVVNSTNTTILMGGGGSFGQLSQFIAVSPQTGQELWRQVLAFDPELGEYGNVFLGERAIFSADGQTGYLAGDRNGDQNAVFQTKFCYFYALDTSSNSVPVNQPPQAVISAPASGLTYAKNAPVNVTAQVTDDGAIDRVEFFYNYNGTATRFATATARGSDGHYHATFSGAAPGTYGIWVRAFDAGGLTDDSETIAAIVRNELPTTTWVSPANGASFPAGQTITLTARGTDADGTITYIEFYSSQVGLVGIDETPDANGNYSVQLVNPPQGAHTLNAWANDNDGSRRAAQINITVGSAPTPTPTPTPTPSPTPVGQPPVVQIVNPASGSSFAPGTSVTIEATASDPDGTIARVDFFDDPWNSSALCTDFNTDANGKYTCVLTYNGVRIFDLYAQARDNSGNVVQSARVRVTFQDPNGALSLSGRVLHEQSTPDRVIPIPNALVKLNINSKAYREVRTDSTGAYLFDHLSQGGQYELVPAEPGYQFFPPAVNYGGLAESATWDFTGRGPLPPGPTPTPTPGASALGWEAFYHGPQNLADFDPHLALDAQGNTYVAGTSGSLGADDTDISVVKYDPAGAQVWAKTFSGDGNYKDFVFDVAADSAGNVYVAGSSYRSNGKYDWVTLKYTTDGTLAWSRYYAGNTANYDYPSAIAVDSAGNVVVVGAAWNRDLGTSNQYNEYTTVKYDPAGTRLWVNRYNLEKRGDGAEGVAIDAANNIYVTGTVNYFVNGAGQDIVTFKYAPDGSTVWSARFDGVHTGGAPDQDEAEGVKVDAAGNVYVYGSNWPIGGSGTDGNGTGETRHDFLVIKYNTAGAQQWSRNWDPSQGDDDGANDLAVDSAGNVYVTGDTLDGAYGYTTTDAATIKYDAAGNQVWTSVYRGFAGRNDAARSLRLDSSGNVYVGLSSEGLGNFDAAVIRYNADGTIKWLYRYDNPNHTDDSLREMEVDGAGNVHFTGTANVPNRGLDFETVKLLASAAGLNAPPDVTLHVGPTIVGEPVTQEAAATGDTPGANGPTIVGRMLTLSADAFDRDGTVARVDFYANGTLLGSDTTSPYTFEWTNVVPGAYAVTATATDNAGAVRSSKTETVTITDGPAPTPTPTPAPAARVNVALSTNGATAVASSQHSASFPAASVINGDRKGTGWGAGGGWNDATGDSYPDWLEVTFNGAKTIDEVDVFTVQDAYAAPADPTEAMTFTKYGVTQFEVRYWTGSEWAVVPGCATSGNNKVWRKFSFAPVTTSKIRVVAAGAMSGYTRLVEVEAWQAAAPTSSAGVNVALASQGGVVNASSTYDNRFPAASLNNGDRRGTGWGAGGGWNDATSDAYPDWVEVAFSGAKTINEVDVFTVQDAFASPADPTEAMTFTQYGVTSLRVEQWTGSAWELVSGGQLSSTNKVWNKVTFAPITTTKIRVLVTGAMNGHSRLVEVEAWQGNATPTPTPTPSPTPAPTGRVNVALASNGATAAASSTHNSNFPAASAINGDRKGLNWGAGGGWNDATEHSYPDWLEVTFNGAKTIDEVNIFTLQDNFASPSEPTETTTFTQYGVVAFEAQFWTGSGWVALPGGSIAGNNKVWRKLTFTPITTTKIRVLVHVARNGSSRLVELEAWQADTTAPTRTNHALATNGATASASSTYGTNFAAAAVNNGDRKGTGWGNGGGWNDGTGDAYPDWVQIDFNGAKSVSEVNVFTVQDAFASPAEPTEAMTFTQYGVTSFDVQTWDGSQWVTVAGGAVNGNDKVWRKLTFPAVTTTKLRVLVKNALGGYSRITEVEAY